MTKFSLNHINTHKTPTDTQFPTQRCRKPPPPTHTQNKPDYTHTLIHTAHRHTHTTGRQGTHTHHTGRHGTHTHRHRQTHTTQADRAHTLTDRETHTHHTGHTHPQTHTHHTTHRQTGHTHSQTQTHHAHTLHTQNHTATQTDLIDVLSPFRCRLRTVLQSQKGPTVQIVSGNVPSGALRGARIYST